MPEKRKRKRGAVGQKRRNIPESLRVVSIDVGLRNLGLAIVEFAIPKSESGCATELGSARDVVMRNIEVVHAENVDVLAENGCTVKNAKTIGPLKQVSFWHACMYSRKALLLDTPPDILVVEVQDGGNATMRQVSTGIVGLFMGHFEARFRDGLISHVPQFTMVRGDMKMKVCALILQAADAPQDTPAVSQSPPAAAAADIVSPAPAAAPPAPPEYLKKINPRRYYAILNAKEGKTTGRSKEAYEKRKRTSVEAFQVWTEDSASSKRFFENVSSKKQRDIADSVFQGMYVVLRELKLDR